MPAGTVSRPWRRYLRFSVWGLIVLVLVIGAGLGWIVHEAHVQCDAVAAIEKAGGTVKYDWEWSNGKSVLGGKLWAPRRVVDLIGVDYFGHVSVVGFPENSGVTDAVFAEVGRLTRVEQLFVRSTAGLCDAGVINLMNSRGLTNFNRLDLHDTRVTDAGLRHLKGLTNLSHLIRVGAGSTFVRSLRAASRKRPRAG
jgi:hypothetical protein